MNHISRLVLLFGGLLLSTAAYCGQAILSGEFDGSEETIPSLMCYTGEAKELQYQVIGPFRVSQSGGYYMSDAGGDNHPATVDVVMRVYEGSFDIHDIQANLVKETFDTSATVSLQTGSDYYMLLQHFCQYSAGPFGIAISGPGTISGSNVVTWPAAWTGSYTGTIDLGWGPLPSSRQGPIRVDRSGTYYFSDIGRHTSGTDTYLRVYVSGFDANDPDLNLVKEVSQFGGALPLQANTDYEFVLYSVNQGENNDWQYVLFPPADGPAFNYFLGGSWHNYSTAGQGILLDILPGDLERDSYIFLAWFTFGSFGGNDRGPGSDTQRWITALGRYPAGGTEVELSFENSYGGSFNSATPAVSQTYPYGSGVIFIDSCSQITLEFNLPSIPDSGTIQLDRSANDPQTMKDCASEGAHAGVIR